MKRIDKLVLDAFTGPFIITFLVVVFILLNINMLKYFDDIIGKDLGGAVISQLFFYFAIFTIPTAMPLAVLLSSLIAFGNLGEHFELTAIKSAGISLLRILRPIFFFVVVLTVLAFLANNYLVPKAALEAYSLLYDIKQKKPALELQEGAFYDGIPGISIKVNKKFPDGRTFNDVVIYDHRKNDGNKEVTVADSGRMYTILNDQYLKLELFKGYNYTEGSGKEKEMTGQKSIGKESLTRSKFQKTQVVFDLSSFQMQTTDKKWFQGNRIMRNLAELDHDIDSMNQQVGQQRYSQYQFRRNFFHFYGRLDPLLIPQSLVDIQAAKDSMQARKYGIQKKEATTVVEKNLSGNIPTKDTVKSDTTKAIAARRTTTAKAPVARKRGLLKTNASVQTNKPVVSGKRSTKKALVVTSPKPRVVQLTDSARRAKIDSVMNTAPDRTTVQNATNAVRQAKTQLSTINTQVKVFEAEIRIYAIQWHYIIASSLACIAMFLIGAPLGAIIKKGGLGMPFLVSILFFIIYYVLTMQGQKFAKLEGYNVALCIYAADGALFLVGMFFLRQARIDARLFESDFYAVALDKFKKWRKNRKKEVASVPV